MYFNKLNPKTKEIENEVNKSIKNFVGKIKNEKKFVNYISSFGIVGTMARSEGIYLNPKVKSDFDFYLISNFMNPLIENKIRKIFNESFPKKLDCSLLYAAPSILNKPDLMFFEYTNSGKVIFGKKIKAIKIEKITKFECFRNICYRSCGFFNLLEISNNKLNIKKNVSTEEFLYEQSKVILGIGEIILLLENKYVASNKKRFEIILKLKSKQLDSDFKKKYKELYQFRTMNKYDTNINYPKEIEFTLFIIKKTFERLFDNLNIDLKKLSKIRRNNLINYSLNLLLFKFRHLTFNKKLNFSAKEPFIELNLLIYNLVNNSHSLISKKDLNKIHFYWKLAPWFYFKIK